MFKCNTYLSEKIKFLLDDVPDAAVNDKMAAGCRKNRSNIYMFWDDAMLLSMTTKCNVFLIGKLTFTAGFF